MNYLGIDFGLKNVGLSLAEGPLAEPLGQIRFSSQKKLLEKIKDNVVDHQVDKIILGLPEGKLAKEVKILGKNITDQFKMKVDYQDETLSTVEARQKLIDAKAPLKKRRKDHMAAATLILQTYLDDHYLP